MMMKKQSVSMLFFLVPGMVLVACGPSPSEIQAQSTEMTASISAKQTAQAPTSTSTPIPAPTITLTPTPTLSPTPAGEKERLAIVEAYSLARDRPVRLQIFTEYSDGKTNTCTHEIDPLNGRSRMKCKDSEVIVINESDRQIVYLRTAQGWVKMERTGLSPSQGGEIEDAIDEITNAQIVGKDLLNGMAVVIYSYGKKIISGTGDNKREYDASIELWVSEVDGLPYKKIVDAILVSGDGKSYKNTTEVAYDVHISIGAP